jgi:hypothetical protein
MAPFDSHANYHHSDVLLRCIIQEFNVLHLLKFRTDPTLLNTLRHE